MSAASPRPWLPCLTLLFVVLSSVPAEAGRRRHNFPPDSTIDVPQAAIVVAAGESVSFSGSGYDGEGNLPLTWAWDFDEASSGVPPSTDAVPGPVVFPVPGTFVVSLAATDSSGITDPTPAQVTVHVTPAAQQVDDADAAFATVGSWSGSGTPAGFVGSGYRRTDGGDGSRTATWTFTVAEAGEHAVFAQWPETATGPSDAPYRVRQGGLDLATVRVDQRTAGGRMNLLGVFDLVPGTVEVVLSNHVPASPPGTKVVADAVRVARDAFAFSSPSPNALSTDGQVTVEIETLGLPPSWGVEVVLDGDDPGAMPLPAPPFGLVLGAIATGEHTLQAFLVDAEGERVIAPPADVAFGVGDRVLAFGDSLVQGTGDDDYSDNTSLDHRVSAKGFTPILNDLLTAGLGRPHAIAKDGAPGRQSAQASGLVAGVLAAHPEASRVLILFGTNDAYWSQRPSGLGLLPGDAGYTDSFKDHMRRIVDAVIADGREPVVAKAPPFAGDFGGPTPLSTLNGLIDAYNQVVDELYLQVPLSVPPPDLYSHFAAFPGEYADDAHPNGAGYQSMAAIWANALVP